MFDKIGLKLNRSKLRGFSVFGSHGAHPPIGRWFYASTIQWYIVAMKIALCQINASMGAVEANASKISRFLSDAKSRGADLAIFPELALPGYPPNDLLDQEGFVEKVQAALSQLAKKHSDQAFIVGTVEKGERVGKGRFN